MSVSGTKIKPRIAATSTLPWDWYAIPPHPPISTHTHTRTHARTHALARAPAHPHPHTHPPHPTPTHTHTRTHARMHVCTHECTLTRMRKSTQYNVSVIFIIISLCDLTTVRLFVHIIYVCDFACVIFALYGYKHILLIARSSCSVFDVMSRIILHEIYLVWTNWKSTIVLGLLTLKWKRR